MSNQKRIQQHNISEYGGAHSRYGLNLAKQHLAEAKAHTPIDSSDQWAKENQIEMLRDVVNRNTEAIAAHEASMAEREAEREKVKADAAVRRKADTLAKLRQFFSGTDEEFEAQAEQLYAEHLRAEMNDAIAQARRNVHI